MVRVGLLGSRQAGHLVGAVEALESRGFHRTLCIQLIILSCMLLTAGYLCVYGYVVVLNKGRSGALVNCEGLLVVRCLDDSNT